MSCWNKEELEDMLEDVINELDLSCLIIEKHGQEGTAPSILVRLVLEEIGLNMVKIITLVMIVILFLVVIIHIIDERTS